jgi:adenine-specific DNA-methyltransferase
LLMDWYFRKTSTNNHVNGYEIEQLPILKIPESEQQPFIELVDKILLDKKAGKETKELEEQIDQLVYKLYELTEEEIKIVEGK